MTTNKPAGYAPDMFSEHARLAQLGAKALEFLRGPGVLGPERTNWRRLGALQDIEQAASNLGLLDEKGGR